MWVHVCHSTHIEVTGHPWVSVLTFHLRQASWPMSSGDFPASTSHLAIGMLGLGANQGLLPVCRGPNSRPQASWQALYHWAIPPVRRTLIRRLGQGQILPGSLGSLVLRSFPFEERDSHVAPGHSFPMCMNLLKGPSPSRRFFNKPHPHRHQEIKKWLCFPFNWEQGQLDCP